MPGGDSQTAAIRKLHKHLAKVGQEVEHLRSHRFQLRVRAALLVVLTRILQECEAHKRRFGVLDGDEQHQLQALAQERSEDVAAAAASIFEHVEHLEEGRTMLGLEG